jgi:hypothetical protein
MKRDYLMWVLAGLLSLSLLLVSLPGGSGRPAFIHGAVNQAAAAGTTVWSIGTLDDSKDEFSGSIGTFTVGSDPDSAFPDRLSGGGTAQTINFNLTAVSGDYFLNVVAADTAQNSTSGMEAIINGYQLTPRWAGSWEFKKWGNGGRQQGVQTLRWALPPAALAVGTNTLQLRVSAAPNAGPSSQPDGVTPYFDMDYVSLEQASLNLAQPRRYIGSTEYWTDDAIIDRKKYNNSLVGDGTVWIDYLLDENTLDSDIEMVEEMNWTASYPDLDWKDVHIGPGTWDEDAWRYYRYTYQQLRAAGVDRVLIKLQYTPRWCSTAPDEPDYDRYPPTSDECWTEFIKETASRLGDVVDDYAIMNEVNMDGFWQGTQAEYEHLMRLAYDILKEYDTIDADGDGVAAFVAPSSSNEPEQVSLWQDYYNHLYPKMDAFHTHDYKWGIKPGVDNIHAIDPGLQYIISETGPANWFINQKAVPEYNPAAMASAIGYLLKDPTSTVDMLIQWLLRGDPDKNCPWPDETEWANTEPDPYANNDGYTETFNSALVNVEPPGPPYTNWSFTSAGAYWQHWGWVFDWDGPQVPVEMAGNGDWQYEVDAVYLGDRIEVIVTNFEGGIMPAPHTIGLRLTTPWDNVKVDRYDPDDFTGTTIVAGPQITLAAADIALDSARWVLSDAGAPQDAVPGVLIASPGKSDTVSRSVAIEADAFDDGSIDAVEYRIDPINEGPFTTMTLQSGSRYIATLDSTALPDGDHSIQVRVRDNAGKSSTVSHVVVVDNGGGSMHVSNIAMSPQNKGVNYQALAMVTIEDANSTPVKGATVYGTFSGATSESVSGTSDSAGNVTLISSTGRNGGTWTFCVDDVVRSGWTYDAGANVETCDSLTAP